MGRRKLTEQEIKRIEKKRKDISSRLEAVARELSFGSVTELFRHLGLIGRTYTDMHWRGSQGKRDYQEIVFEKIDEVFPTINTDWIKTGNGTIHQTASRSIPTTTPSEPTAVKEPTTDYKKEKLDMYLVKNGFGSLFLAGDILQVKAVEEDDIIIYGQPHLIVTVKGDEIIRYLFVDGNNYILRSQDPQSIPDITISKSDVKTVKRIRNLQRSFE